MNNCTHTKKISLKYKRKLEQLKKENLDIKKIQRKRTSTKKNIIYSYLSFIIITFTSLIAAKNAYIIFNSKDLGYSIEYNLTNGFSSHNKLLKVQSISIIEDQGDTIIIKASGLSKTVPHKHISVICNFQRINKIWILKHIY